LLRSAQIALGNFFYPQNDCRLFGMIASYRQLALMDHSLIGNLPHPSATAIVINDIPVDLLKVFGINFESGQNLI
jgi:hypothetical protein